MINYIQILNREILINGTRVIKTTLEKFLNEILINDLTTYKGRIKAISEKYNYKKLIPIYISNELCLIPTDNKRCLENIYINVYAIKYIDQNNIVYFRNLNYIAINKSYKTFKRYVDRALIIQKDKINI